MLLAGFQAVHLRDELDVDDAAEAALEVALTARRLDSAAHRHDLVGDARLPLQVVNLMVDAADDMLGKVGIAKDDTSARESLPLPELGAAFLIVAFELAQGDDEASGVAGGTQA